MKKFSLAGGLLAGLALSAAALPAAAQTVVKQVDDDTLMVVDYSGKPPFKRSFVSLDESPAEFARFEERVGGPLVAGAVERRSGPPGKSLPAQRARVSGDAGEIAEFARFEEGAEAARGPRMWRGAPGKGRPRLTD